MASFENTIIVQDSDLQKLCDLLLASLWVLWTPVYEILVTTLSLIPSHYHRYGIQCIFSLVAR